MFCLWGRIIFFVLARAIEPVLIKLDSGVQCVKFGSYAKPGRDSVLVNHS